MKKFAVAFALMMFVTSAAFASTTTDRIHASKMLIERVTGFEVTDFWSWDYQEKLSSGPNNKVWATAGSVELGNDGVKRKFLCHFVAADLTPLRLQMGNDVLYSIIGW